MNVVSVFVSLHFHLCLLPRLELLKKVEILQLLGSSQDPDKEVNTRNPIMNTPF